MTNYYIIMLPKHRKDKTYAYGPYDNATEVIEEYESRVEMYSDTFEIKLTKECSIHTATEDAAHPVKRDER